MATEASSDWSNPVKFTVAGENWPSIEYGKLLASDGAAGDMFGFSCALNAAGDLALIGAVFDDDKAADAGSVYVFTRSGTTWTQQQKLTASDGTAGDQFGVSCALNATGDLALIGAIAEDDKGMDSGSVYVFTRSGTVWTQQQKILASDGATGEWFGSSCALNAAGDLALISAHGSNIREVGAGAMYCFTRAGTIWTQVTKIYASDAAAGDGFGVSCALNAAGDLALIGAHQDDDSGSNSGSVYVFTRTGSVWTQQQKLKASDGTVDDIFGTGCALNAAGDLALIGARLDDDKGNNSGSVYVFTRSGTVWTQQQKLLASDGVTSDQFGQSCALNAVGDLALIGAVGDDDKGADSGSVYVFS